MSEEVNHGAIMKALDYCYEKAINGLPGFDTAQELAQSYITESGTLQDKSNSLIRWQIAKAGTSGFLTGLGGIITLPVAIPANITTVLYVQIRMIAAIAHIGGHDVHDDKVKTLVYMCLCGSAATDIVKDVGIQIGTKLSINAINNISGTTLTKINQAVGFRFLTKFGEKGVINLGKAVPFLGGIIGGTVDSITTNTIGNIAVKTFINE